MDCGKNKTRFVFLVDGVGVTLGMPPPKHKRKQTRVRTHRRTRVRTHQRQQTCERTNKCNKTNQNKPNDSIIILKQKHNCVLSVGCVGGETDFPDCVHLSLPDTLFLSNDVVILPMSSINVDTLTSLEIEIDYNSEIQPIFNNNCEPTITINEKNIIYSNFIYIILYIIK